MRGVQAGDEDIGKVYGPFTVIGVVPKVGNARTLYKMVCKEGHQTERRADTVKSAKNLKCSICDGNPNRCSRAYKSWEGMIQRCRNPNNTNYCNYGAKGVKVFAEWSLPGGKGFKNFFDYMGECPEGMSIDRYPDKTGNYEPGNVRWANGSDQIYNQKKSTRNTSGRVGVSWDKGKSKWKAFISVEKEDIFLGRYDSFEDAVKVRELAEIEYYGVNRD